MIIANSTFIYGIRNTFPCLREARSFLAKSAAFNHTLDHTERVYDALPIVGVDSLRVAHELAVAQVVVLMVGAVGVLLTATIVGSAGACAVWAIVARRTGISVFTQGNLVGVLAALTLFTRVCSARVVVITVKEGLSGGAFPGHALVPNRTRITILAPGIQGTVDTTARIVRVAGIFGAPVVVVALNGDTDTLPFQARIIRSAPVAVIARAGSQCIGAALLGGAGVLGARVLIVARQSLRSRLTQAVNAGVADGAQIGIVTTDGNRRVVATARRCARVLCAGGLVVAVGHIGAWHALAIPTGVSQCAQVTVVAGQSVWRVQAARIRVARVVGARILVVTNHWEAGLALPVVTIIAGSAFIVVVAGHGEWKELTSWGRIADILSAIVVVVALESSQSRHANSVGAGVSQGAGIVIIAGQVVG
jgi:hypothetical protein